MQQRPHRAADPIELATASLARGDRTRRELDARLERAGIDVEKREAALETLERIGYVDDTRVAVSRAEALAARGQGDDAIRFDLERRGLAAEQVEAALAVLRPEVERAQEVADRLGATPKTLAQLRRKGFCADSLESVFGRVIAGDDV